MFKFNEFATTVSLVYLGKSFYVLYWTVHSISKSKLTPESKAQPPAASSSFSLRSEERASKRKEAKSKTQFQSNLFFSFNLVSLIVLFFSDYLFICSLATSVLPEARAETEYDGSQRGTTPIET